MLYFYDVYAVGAAWSVEQYEDWITSTSWSVNAYPSFNYDSVMGYSASGVTDSIQNILNSNSSAYGSFSNGTSQQCMYEYQLNGDTLQRRKVYRTSSPSKGEFIERITAEDGTYPSDGQQSGKWYVKGEAVPNKYLIQDGEEIKTYLNNSWESVGTVPATKDMFETKGMDSISSIPVPDFNNDMKILYWSLSNLQKQISVTVPQSKYDSALKLYKGQEIIETETELLDTSIKTLVIIADQEGCTFQYSLDDGKTWYNIDIDEETDVSEHQGNQLKIRVNLPDNNASLSALSYSWA